METMPNELNKFNWGAFLLNWIWGIMHGKYITLLYFPACIIPVIGPIIISIWFGIMGNRWAWESKNWISVEEFNNAQKLYIKIWFVLAIFGTIILTKIFFILAALGSNQIQ